MLKQIDNASVQIRLVLSIAARDAPKRCLSTFVFCAILGVYAGFPAALICGSLIFSYEATNFVLRRTLPPKDKPISSFRTAVVLMTFGLATFAYGLPGILLMQMPYHAAQITGLLWLSGMAVHVVGAHATIVLLGWFTAITVLVLMAIGIVTAHPGPHIQIGPLDWVMLGVAGAFWAGNLVEVLVAQEKNRNAFGRARYVAEQRLKQLDYLASHDALTGLLNRRAFDEALLDALNFEQDTAVLLIDLDHFKQINDTMGHSAGDAVLCEQAARIEALFGKGNAARLGGDEFAVLVRNVSDRAAVEAAADALRERLYEPVENNDQTITVGASVGFAFGKHPEATVEGLCAAADADMYRDKNAHHDQATQQAS
ncbi:MAG: diguanylate cyclase [Paracoccaceae bacterium]|nr:diguanylate cyclase [Paracoccaceae bacterium]